MHQVICRSLFLGQVLALAGTTSAYQFRTRFVEQYGPHPSDYNSLPGNEADFTDGAPRSIRIQFGLFDDAGGPSPQGGFVGWRLGSITVNAPASYADVTRTDGPNGAPRVHPFDSVPGGDGQPPDDPFILINGIDNTADPQTLTWTFGQPQPEPTIYGWNNWVSTYEITIDPSPVAFDFSIDFSGELIAATDWIIDGSPIPPAGPDEPGSVTFAPLLTPAQPFSASLFVLPNCPAPSAACLFLLPVLSIRRNRRPACD